MKYSELIELLEKASDASDEVVRAVLAALPKALARLEANEQVRTPLGTFTAWPKAEKKIRLPDGREVSRKEEVVVRLRPGKALKRNK
jgi:nucleoid DNA-binding protein